MSRSGLITLTAVLASAAVASAATCDTSALNTTLGIYPVTVAGTTIADIAKATGRGYCNLARINFMADPVSLSPHALTTPYRYSNPQLTRLTQGYRAQRRPDDRHPARGLPGRG